MLTDRREKAVPITDRPMSATELLDAAFAVFRQRPMTMLVISVFAVLPMNLLSTFFIANSQGGAAGRPIRERFGAIRDGDISVVTALLPAIPEWFALAFTGVAVSLVVDSWSRGADLKGWEAVVATFKRMHVLVLAFAGIHFLELVGSVMILPGIWAMVMFSLTSPVIGLEGLGPLTSMRRSMTLVRRHQSGVISLMMLLGFVVTIASSVIEQGPEWFAGFFQIELPNLVTEVVVLAGQVVIAPIIAAAMTLAYFDVRYRSEGLDLLQRISRANP